MSLKKGGPAFLVIAAGVVLALAVASGNITLPSSAPVSVATASPAASPEPVPTPTAAPAATPAPTPTVQTVRFSASGDNLIHEGLYNQAHARAENGGYDFTAAYADLKEFYGGFDLNWINQETLVNDAYPPSAYPMFSTPAEMAENLYQVGFRAFSLSNNHSYDKGADGISSSLACWDALPEDAVATGFYNLSTYDNYAYLTVNGITFGFLSYTQFTNGIPTPSGSEYGVIYLNQTDVIEKQISDMRPNCDVLVVSCHWGVEDSHDVTEQQRNTAQWLADQGADLIIGTHPHVTQTAQWLTAADGTDAFVVYSLGNLISAQSKPDNMIGLILDITFQKTTAPDGTTNIQILDPSLHPTVTQYENGYRNIRVMLFQDYTDALGAAHGVFTLSRSYIQDVLNQTVDTSFLAA